MSNRTCKCGKILKLVKGSDLDPETHFADRDYLVCTSCGNEELVRKPTRNRKAKLEVTDA